MTFYQIHDANSDPCAAGYDGNLFGSYDEAVATLAAIAIMGTEWAGLSVVEITEAVAKAHPLYSVYADAVAS